MRSALSKFYLDVTKYNVLFSVLIGGLRGVIPGIACLGTFGMIVGIICYEYYRSNQYYFYYNLGFTKLKLIATTWIINLIFSTLLLLIIHHV